MGSCAIWVDWDEFRSWGSEDLDPFPFIEGERKIGLERILMTWAVVHENLVRGDRYGYVACFFYGVPQEGPILIGEKFRAG